MIRRQVFLLRDLGLMKLRFIGGREKSKGIMVVINYKLGITLFLGIWGNREIIMSFKMFF